MATPCHGVVGAVELVTSDGKVRTTVQKFSITDATGNLVFTPGGEQFHEMILEHTRLQVALAERGWAEEAPLSRDVLKGGALRPVS